MQHYNAATQNEYAASKNNYKYNGKEIFEEMNLGLYMYGARWYDACIGRFSTMDPVVGRFMTVDPKAALYASLNPYNYVGNNPLIRIDPLGDTLRGVNEASAQRALSLIQGSFNKVSIASSLFKLGDDGITFNSISSKDINKALSSLNEAEGAMFLGYAMAINHKEINMVEVVNRNENMSKLGKNILSAQGFTEYKGSTLDEYSGGGYSHLFSNGNSYSIVVGNPKTKTMFNNGTEQIMIPGSVLSHELLGHNFTRKYGFHDYDNSVRAENLYYKAKGIGLYRWTHNGPSGHSNGLNYGPNEIPPYLSLKNFSRFLIY